MTEVPYVCECGQEANFGIADKDANITWYCHDCMDEPEEKITWIDIDDEEEP